MASLGVVDLEQVLCLLVRRYPRVINTMYGQRLVTARLC